MIRLDGVVGNIVKEASTNFNLFIHDPPPIELFYIYASVTRSRKKLAEYIFSQPSPYREMELLSGVLDAIKIMKMRGWTVKIFTDPSFKKEKKTWLKQNSLPTQDILWSVPSLEKTEVNLIIDHEFNITNDSHHLVFCPYTGSTKDSSKIQTWNDSWLEKIKKKLLAQGLKEC